MKQEHWIEEIRDKLADYQEPVPDDLWAGIEDKLNESFHPAPSTLHPLRRWVAAAAVVLLLAGGTLLLWNNEEKTAQEPMTAQVLTVPALEDQQQDSPLQKENTNEAAIHPVLTDVTTVGTDEEHEAGSKAEIVTETATEPETSVETEKNPATSVETGKNPETSTEFGKTAVQTGHADHLPQKDYPAIRKKTGSKPSLTATLYAGNGLDDQNNNDRVQMSQELTEKFLQPDGVYASRATSTIWLTDYEERQYHERPVTIGLQLGYPLNNRLSLNTGVVYTKLRSQFTNIMKGREIEQQQSLHYIGLPLILQYRLLQFRHLNVYVSAGGQADWNVSSRRFVNDRQVTIGKDRCQWSLSGNLGLSYDLTKHIGIYVEPGIRHYLDNHSDVQNFFKEKPTAFSLQLGLRLEIGKKE